MRSLYYCLFAPHIYGVVLRAHSVRGEPRVQRNANGEVATQAGGKIRPELQYTSQASN